MTTSETQPAGQGAPDYTLFFARPGAAAKYANKFSAKIDFFRHLREVAPLARHASGSLFDCSIAVGRFIDRLPGISAYKGMDYSQEFVSYISGKFPEVPVYQANLLEPLREQDGAHDTVICIRTLGSLGHLDTILPEMVRVCKTGGLVVFDYPTIETQWKNLRGETVALEHADPRAVLADLPCRIERIYDLDRIFGVLKRKGSIYRLLRGWLRFVPTRVALFLDRLPITRAERVLYVVRKTK